VGPTASGTPSNTNRLLPTGIVGGILMRHFDLLLMRHPHLRSIDYQRLVQRVKTDPPAHWDEFVTACAPIVLTAALRMARPVGNVKALAEQAVVQVFQMLAENDYALIRAYVGYGKFPSELVRLTQLVPALAEPRQGREFPALSGETAIEDADAPVPALDARYVELLEKEGDRFVTAVRRVVQVLHRQDRLMLGLRYEQGLSVRELDQVFRLGTPERVAGILDRLVLDLQPVVAVASAWELDHAQRHALARRVLFRVFSEGSLESNEDLATSPALQHH
jgi:hypothetical protein